MTADDPRRPDPDALLAQAGGPRRGRLKVYLGMAPGVGKTYEMLTAAARRQASGGEVLVGVVETHGRGETEGLIAPLEVLARKPVEHRGRLLMEFDLDSALARKPALLLVDEYAHSNAPGSRHAKRWQDVEELLGAGIDVWTTLNVQHLESLVEVVWKITGVRQRETVPDSALSRADEIELIDITPDELRGRMREGKVYMGETAKVAADNFFKPENLTALRELALRRAAQTVDDQLTQAMRRAGVEGPWAAGERILVLIGADPMAPALVRAGRRLADLMNAPWTVAHVERPSHPPERTGGVQLAEALKLAEQLDAASLVMTADDLAGAVLDHARRNNVTQIVVGQTPRLRLSRLGRKRLLPVLLSQAQGVALHVITDAGGREPAPAPPPRIRRQPPWLGLAGAMALTALAAFVASLFDRATSGADLAMVFLLSVLVSGLAFGLWPAVLAAALSALVYNFLFLAPRLSLSIGRPTDLFTFAVFFVVALATGWLTGRVRDQTRAVSRRASAISALLAASRRLSGAARREDAAQALAEQLAATTSGRALVLTPQGGDIVLTASAPGEAVLTTTDLAAARWAWEKGDPAGAGAATLPNAAWAFRPLQGLKVRAGVAGLEARALESEEDARFVAALLDQGAVALERAEFAAEAADAEALRRSDRLRNALLNSVSHDLRTPLSTVLGSVTTLIDYGKNLAAPVRADLLRSIREEAERLNRYVGDLLDMSRLEGGALVTRQDWCDLRDVVAAAVGRVERRLGERHVDSDAPPQLSMVKADPSLLEQALVNILENAIAYSPDGSTIETAVYEDRSNVVISIEDEGKGIPTSELERVFEKFRRMEESSDRGKGAGLGLAIAKGFVEAMGGRIAAASPIHDGRGTRILISLKKEIQTPAALL